MIAVGALHDAADLAGLKGQGGLLKGGDHLAGLGLVALGAVHVAGGVGVLAVLLHQLIKQGLLVAGGLELGENVLGGGLLLGHGGVVQRLVLAGGLAVRVLDGLAGVHGFEQDVLGLVGDLQIVGDVGKDVLILGRVGSAIAVVAVHQLGVQVAGLHHAGVQVPGEGAGPEHVIYHGIAPGLLGKAVYGLLDGLSGLVRDRQALLLGDDRDQSVQSGGLQGVVQKALRHGGAVLHLGVPGQVRGAHAHHGVVLSSAVHGGGQPVEQAVGGDLRVAHRGHHGVAGETGGGQEGVGHGGEVHGLDLGGAAVAGAAGAAALCTAAGEGGEGQNKRQGEGSQTFQGRHGTDPFLFHDNFRLN